MVRWIAFDNETAETVVNKFKRGAAEIRQGDALGAALAAPAHSLLLLPAASGQEVLVVSLKKKPPSPAAPTLARNAPAQSAA
jgi:hypothetical protein